MIKKFKIIKLTSILLFFVLSIMCICGCRYTSPIIQRVIVSDLKTRYGLDFNIISIVKDGRVYRAVCSPDEDLTLRFGCMYSDEGEFGYDYYVGALIAREEEQLLKEQIGNEFGDVFVKGSFPIIITEDTYEDDDKSLLICDLIKNGEFMIKKAYEIHPISELAFYIFVNSSDKNLDSGMEYDILQNAVNNTVSRYYEEYGLSIYIHMYIIFLEDNQYKDLINNFENSNSIDNLESSEIENNSIILEMGIPGENISSNLWLSREEYIEKRRDMENE